MEFESGKTAADRLLMKDGRPAVNRIMGVVVLVLIVSLTSATHAASDVPDWIKLKTGRVAYFGIGYPGLAPACPTFDRYVEWLKSSQQRRAGMCPTAQGGQKVTIVDWKMHALGPGLIAPIVHVRFARAPSFAWTLAVDPVVPAGAVVAITGGDCTNEVDRTHADASSAAKTLSACRASVVQQSVSSTRNTLLVRFLRSGTLNRVPANSAVLPTALFPNGLPRYDVAHFLAQ
jgi:hypothetical protein